MGGLQVCFNFQKAIGRHIETLTLCLLLSQAISTDNSAKSFNLLSSSGLQQHIHSATHKKGHTLDLLITRDVDPHVIGDISITAGISDHSAILGKIHMQRPPVQKNVIRSRNIAAIKLPLFCDDLIEVINPDCLNTSLYAQVERYNSVLSQALENHAPMKERCVKLHPDYPWF